MNKYLPSALVLVMLGFMSLINAHAASYEGRLQLKPPVIGVAGSGYASKSVRYTMAALTDAGAYPILLDTRKPNAVAEHLDVLNGIVIAGNSLDINPEDYGAISHARTRNEDAEATTEWDLQRDDYEYALIDAATARKIPFLGICSGMQRLNVAGGGTLAQHIDDQLIWAEDQLPHQPILGIQTIEDTKLAGITVDASFKDNSLHHQHVKQLREGFRVAARDVQTQIVEAIEADPKGAYADHPFLMGVQWHPEYGASDASRRIIKALVEAAKAHAQQSDWSKDKVKAVDASPLPLRDLVSKGVSGMRRVIGYSQPEWALSP